MNFVISHRQTSQSDPNPVILPPNHSTSNCCTLHQNARGPPFPFFVLRTAHKRNVGGKQSVIRRLRCGKVTLRRIFSDAVVKSVLKQVTRSETDLGLLRTGVWPRQSFCLK